MQMNEQLSAQQVVLMPVAVQAPKKKQKKQKKANKQVANKEEIQAIRDEVVMYSSRIHVTSILLSLIGTVGACVSMYKAFNARHIAQSKLQIKVEGTTKVEMNQEFISADMFSLVDGIRIVHFLTFVLSMFIVTLGRIGMRSTQKLKSKASNRIFKRSIVKLVLIAGLVFATRHYVKENKAIVLKHNKLNETPIKKDRKLAAFREEDDLEATWERVNAEIQEHANQYIMQQKRETQPEIQKEEIVVKDEPKAKKTMKNKKLHGKAKKAAKQAAKAEKRAAKKAVKTEKKAAKKAVKTEKEADKKTWVYKMAEKYVKGMEQNMAKFNPEQKANGFTDQLRNHFLQRYQKQHQRRVNGKRKSCTLIGALFAILIVSHLYQVKHLGQSLAKLESFGINAKKEKKNQKKLKKLQKQNKTVSAVVEEDLISEIAPAEMNYSFDSMNDESVKFEFPVVQQPAPTYIINDSAHQMC